MNWMNLKKERIDLALPLLIVKGTRGFLACGNVNIETCDKTGEACAIVTGVKDHEEMLAAEVKAVSQQGKALGITVGMTGQEALELFRRDA